MVLDTQKWRITESGTRYDEVDFERNRICSFILFGIKSTLNFVRAVSLVIIIIIRAKLWFLIVRRTKVEKRSAETKSFWSHFPMIYNVIYSVQQSFRESHLRLPPLLATLKGYTHTRRSTRKVQRGIWNWDRRNFLIFFLSVSFWLRFFFLLFLFFSKSCHRDYDSWVFIKLFPRTDKKVIEEKASS